MIKIRLVEEDIYDYGTGNVDGSDIFSSRQTGMSFYDDLINQPEYMAKNKNLKATIVQMSPKEYFEGCADIFGNTYEHQINQIKSDSEVIENLKEIITKHKKKFPLTFLNYAQNTQEGRHRIYVAGELFGWNTKFPVMIVNWVDEKRASNEKESERKKMLEDKLRYIERNALQYNYRNLDELVDQVHWEVSRYIDENDVDNFSAKIKGNTVVLQYHDISLEIDPEEIKFKESDDDDIELYNDEEDIDLDDWMKKNFPGWK